MNQSTTSDAAKETGNTALVSQASILILAGVLMGTALGGFVSPTLRLPVFACGAVGAIGYLGLSLLSKRNRS